MQYDENDSHVHAVPAETVPASAQPVPNAGFPVQPDEPEKFDEETPDDADETVADFDADEQDASAEGESRDAA